MTRANYRPLIKTYILDCINDEDHEIENPTDKQLWSYINDRIVSEYGFMIKRVGKQNAIREWLLGLAIGCAYTYCDIEKLLKEWGIIKPEMSESKIDKELDQYWTRLAAVITQETNKF